MPEPNIPKDTKTSDKKTDQSTKSTEQVVKPTEQPAEKKDDITPILKEVEAAIVVIKVYPVASKEDAKNEAVEKIVKTFNSGNDTVKQLILYMMHENLAQTIEMKIMHTFDYFKAKNPAQEPAQLRMNVYRAMFNYNTSIEGIVELIKILARLRGDDSAKLLTYHFTHLCTYESEANHMMRSAILEALGTSESLYALRALIDYAKYGDSERMLNRIVRALAKWNDKVDLLKISEKEKTELKKELQEIMTNDLGGAHYG
ncbi:hypothetical protein HY988_00125 [Candidatus Micrarchaeota archaeon]|nr:hypothetical protein [Candidatus Micrarchaeota archaeon]